MENELTLDQALQNVQIVLDNFVGKKADHIALEQSMIIIKNHLNVPKKIIETNNEIKDDNKDL